MQEGFEFHPQSKKISVMGPKIGFLKAELSKRTPETQVNVGSHMTIDPQTYQSERILPDGSILEPGEKIGIIHFSRNILVLRKHENIISVGRRLFRSAQISLYRLAELCEKNAKALEGVKIFLGASHIAGSLAKRLGFSIFSIENKIEKQYVKMKSEGLVRAVAKKNPHWKKFEKNLKSPNIAMISREELIRLYGTQTRQQPTLTNRKKPEQVNF